MLLPFTTAPLGEEVGWRGFSPTSDAKAVRAAREKNLTIVLVTQAVVALVGRKRLGRKLADWLETLGAESIAADRP